MIGRAVAPVPLPHAPASVPLAFAVGVRVGHRAVRAQLPEGDLTPSLTASLAMTVPFNLLVGIPLRGWMAQRMAGT